MIAAGSRKIKIYFARDSTVQKIKKGDLGSTQIYSSGGVVTYQVDSGVAYTEEVDEGADVLHPASFTPSKSGYTFIGWREDASASADVLTSKTLAAETLTLYAVFRKSYTLTLYNASTTASQSTHYQYYNNGNVNNPTVTLTEAALSGWTAAGWTTNAGGYAATVANGGTVTLAANATYYSLYAQTIHCYAYNASTSPVDLTGTRVVNYHSAVTYSNPSFTLTQVGVSGWSAAGWTTNAGGYAATVANGGTVTLAANATYYSLYAQTIHCYAYNASTSPVDLTGTRVVNYHSAVTYSNPSFTLTQAGVSGWSAAGWTTNAGGYAAMVANGGTVTLAANATYYSLYAQTIHCYAYNASATPVDLTGTRVANYHNAVTYSNPSFTLTQAGVSGWTAAGWQTGASGYAPTVANGGTVTLAASASYFGVYNKVCYVYYYANGADGGSTPTGYGYAYYNSYAGVTNASVALSANGYTYTNHSFVAWALNGGTQYAPGATISISDSVTMYAVWYQINIYLTFTDYTHQNYSSGDVNDITVWPYESTYVDVYVRAGEDDCHAGCGIQIPMNGRNNVAVDYSVISTNDEWYTIPELKTLAYYWNAPQYTGSSHGPNTGHITDANRSGTLYLTNVTQHGLSDGNTAWIGLGVDSNGYNHSCKVRFTNLRVY